MTIQGSVFTRRQGVSFRPSLTLGSVPPWARTAPVWLCLVPSITGQASAPAGGMCWSPGRALWASLACLHRAETLGGLFRSRPPWVAVAQRSENASLHSSMERPVFRSDGSLRVCASTAIWLPSPILARRWPGRLPAWGTRRKRPALVDDVSIEFSGGSRCRGLEPAGRSGRHIILVAYDRPRT